MPTPAADPAPPAWPAPLATPRRRLVVLVVVVTVVGLVAAMVTRGGGEDTNDEANALAARSPADSDADADAAAGAAAGAAARAGTNGGTGDASTGPEPTAPTGPASPSTSAAPPATAPTTAPPTTALTTGPVSPASEASPAATDGAPLGATLGATGAGTGAGAGRALCVGDSVMLSASPGYHDTLAACATIDAVVSRQMSDGAAVVRAHAPYPGAVVVGLGSNGTVDRADLDALLGELRGVPRVVLVTVQLRGGRSWEGQVNGEITAAPARWANVRVADWEAASDAHPEYTGDDGIHLSAAGAPAYAATIAAAL